MSVECLSDGLKASDWNYGWKPCLYNHVVSFIRVSLLRLFSYLFQDLCFVAVMTCFYIFSTLHRFLVQFII